MSSPPSIHSVFFVELPTFGGGPHGRLLRLAKGWAARGYPTAIAALLGDEQPGDKERAAGNLSFFQLTGGSREVLKSFRLDTAWAVRAWVQRHRPQLIFSMESLVDYHVKIALLGLNWSTVTLIGIDRWLWERRRYRVTAMRLLARKSAAIIGNSAATLAGYRRVLGAGRFDAIPHTVLHNPVDADEFTPRTDRDHPDTLVIGGMGRFRPQKGFDVLIEAFAQLPPAFAGKRLRLRLKGRGPLQPDLEALAARLGVRERVEFVPYSPEIEGYLHSLDCLIVPSRWAGFENVALEGILTGTPTLCSRATGLQELPADPCLRFIDLDPGRMSAQLAEFLGQSPVERQAIAEAQRNFVTGHLALDKVAGRLEDFLRANRITGAPSPAA